MYKSSLKSLKAENNWQALLQKVGSQTHKYQLLSFALFMVEWLLAGFILLGMNFLFITSEFDCKFDPLLDAEQCAKLVCQMPSDQWQAFLRDISISSIVYDLDPPLMCDQEYVISILQSLVYVGSLLGFFIFPYIADNYGRKPALSAAWWITAIGSIIFTLALNLWTVGLGLFLAGFGVNSGITLHFSFLSEQVTGKTRETMCAALQIAFACGQVLIALAFYLQPDWRLNSIFLICIPAVITSLLNHLLVQSPKFQISRSKEQALVSLNLIAEINGRRCLEMAQMRKIQVGEQENGLSMLDLFKYKSLRMNAVLSSLVFFQIQFVYYGIIFILEDVGLSIYLNQILLGLSEIMGYSFVELIISRARRIRYVFVSLILCAFLTALLLLVNILKPQDCDTCIYSILQLVLLFLVRFILCSSWSFFYVYLSQLFPTKVRSLALGWASQVGSVGSTLSPFVNRLDYSVGYFAVTAGLSAAASFPLPETLGKPIEDEIQQLRQENKKKMNQ